MVKAFVREDYENEKFSKAATKLYELFVSAEKLQALNLPVMMFIVYGCIIAISWSGAHFIAAGSMTTGNLTSLFSYVMTAFSSLMMLSMIFVMMTMSATSGKRIAEVLEEKADITAPPKTLDCVRDGSIDFDHVTFSYRQGSGGKTLSDIDLHIKSGETIGIIGGTGCGKSSLVSLISRLYDVASGSVKVGGEDVRSYDLETLRNQVAVVLQKNVLFSGTVLENLRWGKEMGHTEEYREACRMACADEFIEHLPKGYDAWVERGGANFSGGQKQRLCIARALLKQPRVLILGAAWGVWHVFLDFFFYTTPDRGVIMLISQMITCVTLGIFFAWAYLKTNNIWVPVIMHFLNNNLILVIANDYSADVIENQQVTWGMIPSALLLNGVVFGLFLLSKEFRSGKQ